MNDIQKKLKKNNIKRGAVLITGGGKRLGSLVALNLARKGWKILLHYNQSEADANATKEKIKKEGGKVDLIKKEILNQSAANELIKLALRSCLNDKEIKQFTLINNASAFLYDKGKDFEEETLETHMHANFKIPALLTQSLYNNLSKKINGNVINMLDAKLFGINADHFTYTLSKFALLGLTKLAALSYAPKLRVNGVAPGITLPNPGHSMKDFARIQELNPLLKGSSHQDIFNAIVFLIKTSSITGETILVDGGAHLSPQKRDATFL
tara:strand:+ start:214 stop:1017 length:804 start_codon:yes stop_codon:yes gene_type:complete